MKKILIVMFFSFAIILCGCENNASPVVEDTDIAVQTENENDILISEPSDTQPISIAQVRLKSVNDYKLFIDKEKRNVLLQNHQLPLSNRDIERLCEISDNLANETVYTVSNSKEYVGTFIEDRSYARMYDYAYHYGYENYFVEFNIPIDEKARTTLIDQGILEYIMMYDKPLAETDGGFTNSRGDVYFPTKITIEDKELDALYVRYYQGTTCFYFELSGQVAQIYLNTPTTFEEGLELAESLGIQKLNLNE